MNVTQNLPLPTDPVIDLRTGQMTVQWYRFFLTLFNRTGQSIGFDAAEIAALVSIGLLTGDDAESASLGAAELPALLLSDTPVRHEQGVFLGADFTAPSPLVLSDYLLAALMTGESKSGAPPIIPVTLGASPATYAAPVDGNLLLTGGATSVITISRDGATFLPTGLGGTFGGFVPMSRGDQAVVTYTVAPTDQNFIPR